MHLYHYMFVISGVLVVDVVFVVVVTIFSSSLNRPHIIVVGYDTDNICKHKHDIKLNGFHSTRVCLSNTQLCTVSLSLSVNEKCTKYMAACKNSSAMSCNQCMPVFPFCRLSYARIRPYITEKYWLLSSRAY